MPKIRFRPMGTNDYTPGGEIEDTLERGSIQRLETSYDSLLGDNKHGLHNRQGYKLTRSENVRGYITLTVPIINPILAGNNCSFAAKFLKTKSWEKNIFNCIEVYSISKERAVPVGEIEDIEDMLLPGEYIEKLITEFDISKRIIYVLNSIISESFDGTNPKLFGEVRKSKEYKGSLVLFDCVYHIQNGDIGKLKDGLSWGDVMADMYHKVENEELHIDIGTRNSLQQIKEFLENNYLKSYIDVNDPYFKQYEKETKMEHWEQLKVVPLMNDYVYYPSDKDTISIYKILEKVYEYIHPSLTQKGLVSRDSKLTDLLNMKVENLKGFIMHRVVVLPPVMRPTIERRPDYLTIAYDDIFNADRLLNEQIRIKTPSPQGVFASYLNLQQKVNYLLDRKDPTNTRAMPIKYKVQGKGRFFREYMLSKRQDYAGHSVITINPNLSLTQCGVPKEMLVDLMAYHLVNRGDFESYQIMKDNNDIDGLIYKLTEMNCISMHGMGDIDDNLPREKQDTTGQIPLALNRAPTLHKLSILGFNIIPIDGQAIQIPCAITEGFNADFDGDQMAVHIPIKDKSIQEIYDILMSSKNLFVPANGSITAKPKHEVIYGLSVLYKKNYKRKDNIVSYKDLQSVVNAVKVRDICVEQFIKVGGRVGLVGYFVIEWAVGSSVIRGIQKKYGLGSNEALEFDKKVLIIYLNEALKGTTESYIKVVDRLTHIGFRIAKLYAPSISILSPETRRPEFKKEFDKLHTAIAESRKFHDMGMEEDITYEEKYSEAFQITEKNIEKMIKDGILGENNGFVKLVNAGARGTIANLIQIYGCKGRIAKSDVEAFNAAIEDSFAEQLTSLEHYLSAYGARKGLIDKTRKPADTGYASRKMWNTTANAKIITEDCGTRNGILLSEEALEPFIKNSDINTAQLLSNMIEGRYCFVPKHILNVAYCYTRNEETYKQDLLSYKYYEDNNDYVEVYVTEEIAKLITGQMNKILMRSPITCNDPYCSHCYGKDLSIQGKAVIGLPIGYIAAQSIGEVGTQLTMRTFHTGGIAGKGDITSDFDRFRDYVDKVNLREKKSFTTYDPIAWATGTVQRKPVNNGMSIQVRIGKSPRSMIMNAKAELKDYVKRGEGLSKEQGDYYLQELEVNKSIKDAQLYALFMFYNIYRKQGDINMKHFEILVAEMSLCKIISTDREDLREGLYYSLADIKGKRNKNGKRLPYDRTIYYQTLVSINKVPLIKASALTLINMENAANGIAKINIIGLEDDTKYSATSAFMLAEAPNSGMKLNPNFAKEREMASCKEQLLYTKANKQL